MKIQPNWLSKNVRSIIALVIVAYALNFFSMILILHYANEQLIDRMETSLNNLVMFVLGFYFSANHHPIIEVPKNIEIDKSSPVNNSPGS